MITRIWTINILQAWSIGVVAKVPSYIPAELEPERKGIYEAIIGSFLNLFACLSACL